MDAVSDHLTLAVPNFNGAKYLPATLQSLAVQGDRVRWWLQDACSTDDSLSIARSFARPEDHVVCEKDSGQADGINRAVGSMGGGIIGWLNADDCLTPGAASKVLDAFARHPEADIVVGEVDWIDAGGRVTGHHAGDISSLEAMLNIYEHWWCGRQWVQPEVFWRRALWDKVGGLNTNYDLAFDFDFWVRCLEAGARVVHLPETLVQFRIHADQKSSRATEAADEIRDIVQHALARNGSFAGRSRLQLQLAYDKYQSGQDFRDARPSLGAMLLRNPRWMLLPEVRRRVVETLTRKVTR